jgi:hypothetical protein
MKIARVVLALAAALPAIANDTAVTIGAGGLIPLNSSSIVMESEDLQVSLRQITVKYLFHNPSSRDVNAIVAFPLPDIDGEELVNVEVDVPSRDPLNYVDFQVAAAGKKITPNVEVRAFRGQTEISDKLRSLGLPLSVLDENVNAAVKKLGDSVRADLQRRGLIDCSLTKDGKCWPYWTSRIKFYWPQRFPAGATIAIEHSYRPIVGGGGPGGAVYGDKSDEGRLKEYCADNAIADQIERQKRLNPVPKGPDGELLDGHDVDYILQTAKNWNGPIRTFRLSVLTDHADDIVATCINGLKRVSPTRYELAYTDYRPERDLKVLILQLIR